MGHELTVRKRGDKIKSDKNARGGLCENDVVQHYVKHQHLALLLNQVEDRLKTKLNSSLWP